ncbi:hypothetical protein EMIHUDRAFT_248163 [Emiliania huxleyi CCMP1516]|uniref:Uncharacterized protein n=2 Tax=Emiliania huxleyi TaxID=2903 RepID=A0A0D3IIA0_EMIH1|nr:hypothetical protein EMIHUDRAFT_248163 [Emiliania huxleyi CCMP1516]EOD10985.1 hypothetical protein EMIHUDRAFT_248163 [Emiliania huxleyi CCMP1516]|eukprot:XP_005763414.1 hypothetical protein EMIHUDRAFT_248163 [Emiliania huxleyi CCMP1516]
MAPYEGWAVARESTGLARIGTNTVQLAIVYHSHYRYATGQCATCGAQLLLKYAHRSMCCRYACLKAAAAKRRARHADGSADDAIVAVLGMHFCDPNQLIATKQRNKLAAANKALC